ncbi:lipid A export permease/ATP-binding protein MsbA [Stenotrophobium rhamnosiphilum]|uniref:Lipid A export permease/ATP-binding protein MsbA n=1 Tax=Stenotrophobium rhamnosiphilum TaxID=2029166 RepID=A0A2T5MKW2_9GAMM|nr:lipid A export permease/ATP-binding protein MsbA [Stenotrophobium rhamnosiphilum]PTU33198.1 lipid A export permease/ATP-binding protein MsbA [Stenotrophobium rhamnosiphilum]
MSDSAPNYLPPLVVYRRLLGYAAPHWRVFILAVIGMVMCAAVDTGFLALMKPLLDVSFVGKDIESTRWIPPIIIGMFLARGLGGFMSTYGMAWIGRRVVTDLRGEVFNHLLKLPVRFYDQSSSGQLISRLTYHVEQVADATTTSLTAIIREGLTLIGLLSWMLYLNWELSLFCFVLGPIIALITGYVSRRFRKISHRIQESVGSVTQAAEESIGSQRVVKVYNGQDFEAAEFKRINEHNRFLSLKVKATAAGSSAVVMFIAAFAVAAIVYFATQPEMLATISAGTFVSFLGAMIGLMNPIKALSGVNEKMQRAVVAGQDIFHLLAEPAEQDGGSRELTRARGHIEFKDVRFRYREELGDALRGVSVTVEPGQTVAFVGRSGSGKSTLLALLPRFYDTDGGAILLDGHDLREYPMTQLRQQIALVDQQVRLFNASIADNIAYGMAEMPSREKIIEAAKSAYAWDFIEKLPDGLDTHIGQNGLMLSGGQRQRIAIARALLKDAPILILDEATSALDTESERYIQAALEKLVIGRTTLVIAHRLSTVQSADKIVVMQDGRIAESGRHAELLEKGGIYAALYRMQFEEDASKNLA